MKIIHLPVQADLSVTLPHNLVQQLPQKVALFTTAQLLNQYDAIADQLISAQKQVIRVKTSHTRKPGQILGCNIQRFDDYTKEQVDAILYVGDGEFHPLAMQYHENIRSFQFNPFTNEQYAPSQDEIEKSRKRRNAALSAFTLAKTVGVLIPLKSGQLYLRWALELKKLYPDKEFINLVDYNVNYGGLEDFPFVEVFVNTACPRIVFDDAKKVSKPIVNLEDVSDSFYQKQLKSATFPPGDAQEK